MADLVVCVDGGADWRRALTFPQLERLGPGSLLFVLAPRGAQVVVVAVVEDAAFGATGLAGGFARELGQDITALLPSLGCPEGAVATWAATPRVLTRSDLDRLRYALSLGELELPTAPDRIVEDDTVQALRAGVWAAPEDDHQRSIYADALIERGDPRGELVALQLARAATGGLPTQRERGVLARCIDDCIAPLGPYLRAPVVLRRGFLAECIVDDHMTMPDEIRAHGAWSTVETLATNQVALMLSPALRSLRRIAIGDIALVRLADAPQLLPITSIVGAPILPTRSPGGGPVVFGGVAPALVDAVKTPGALANVRVLALRDHIRPRVYDVMRGPLGAQLLQLDLLTTLDAPELPELRAVLDRTPIPLLSLRLGLLLTVAIQRAGGRAVAIVEVTDPLATEEARAVVRCVAQLLRPDTSRIEVRDRGFPLHAATRQRELLRLLAPLGRPVDVPTAAVPSLAP